MTFDLRHAHWLPLRRRSGRVEWGSVASIVSKVGGGDDPIVALASPRPDFDGATTEFLIGLLTAAMLPADEQEWRTFWHRPPTEEELQAKLDALPNAFELDGDGPRFHQDVSAADLSDQPVEPIQDLLVNAKNSGLFIKPEVVKAMGRPAAAMALITMQAYSTAGGRGYRTSVRGGGPLTTLVDPRLPDAPETSLWHFLWANVETSQQLEKRAGDEGNARDAAHVFPWLARTRISPNKGDSTTTADAHPLQAYFGMPRRIRLEFNDAPGLCDVTGQPDDRMVVGFRGKSYGINYEGWIHPLSPYYAGKEPNEFLPVHGQPGGIGWRDWLSLLHATGAAPGKRPATTIAHFGRWRADRLGLTRHAIKVFGYDAANAKIRAWISSTLPAFAPTEPERLAALTSVVSALVEATDAAAYVLQHAVDDATHAKADEAPGDRSYVKAALWRRTQDWFFDEINRLVAAQDSETAAADVKDRYLSTLTTTTLALFDELAPSDVTRPELLRRVIGARYGLVGALHGIGKMGEKIFTSLGRVSLGTQRKRKATASKPRTQGAR